MHPDLAFSSVKQRQRELVERLEQRHLHRGAVPRWSQPRPPRRPTRKGGAR
jgi:hypothetical protein